MKRQIGVWLGILVFAGAIQAYGNQTQNAGFEDGLNNWTGFVYGAACPPGHVTVDQTTSQTGTASALISFPVGYSITSFSGISQDLSVVAGSQYLVTASIKFQNTSASHIKVVWYNGSMEIQTDFLMYGGEGTGTSTGWLMKNAVLTAPAGATTASLIILSLQATNPSLPGYLWVDNAGIWSPCGNQFLNAGFENGLFSWVNVGDITTIDPTVSQSGTAGALVTFPIGDPGSSFRGVRQNVWVTAGNTYNVSAAIKFQNTNCSHIKVTWYNNLSWEIQSDYLMYGGEGTGTITGWLVKSAALTAPDGATSGSLQIISLGPVNSSSPGYLWIDNAGIATAEAPVFDPAGPAISQTTSVPVTMASATPGATIYYTLDGTPPTTTSANGTTPVTVTVNSQTTLKAMATAAGCLDSSVTSQTYIHYVDYRVSAISSMTKMRKDQMPSSDSTTYSLNAARGEGESGQIVIGATETLNQVTIEASSLTGPNGATMTPELFRVAYVPITHPIAPPAGFGVAGDYPDPLLPVDTFDVAANTSQSIFFNVWVPADASAGDYTGTMTVKADNGYAKTVSLTLHVYDVDLPLQSFLKTYMQLWDFSQGWYGANYTSSMLERTRLLCLKYRCTSPEWLDLRVFITKNPDGTFTANWGSFDLAVQYCFDHGATTFHLQDLFVCQQYNLPANPQEEADMGVRLALTQAHLEAKGWLDRCFFYIFDEPSSANIPQIKTLCSLIHQYAPKLRVLLTYTSNLGTDSPTTLIGYTNLWVPNMDVFNESFLAARQAAGDEVWCYTCGNPNTPYVHGIDQTGTAARAVGWWCWQYKTTGYLYWCMDYWPTDPWTNPQTSPGSNGEGYLLWPDPNKTHDPYPSIRLACTRDGFEDYDLMVMLRTRINEIKGNNALYQGHKTLVDNAQTLLDTSSVISSKTTFSKDPDVYEQRHQMILENLDVLKNIDTVLAVTPASQSVGASAGTTTFTVANDGTGNMTWSAQVTDGGGWLQITGTIGTNAGTITANYTANTGTQRTGTIHIDAGSAGTADVTVVQAAGQVQSPTVHGTVTYTDYPGFPLNTVTIEIRNGSTVVETHSALALSGSSGSKTYTFTTGLTGGPYTLVIVKNVQTGWKESVQSGVTLAADTTVNFTVTHALAGDASMDNKVDVSDLGILAANYGGTGKTWALGDFSGDGKVDVSDLGILAAHYGQGSGGATQAGDFQQDMKALGFSIDTHTCEPADTQKTQPEENPVAKTLDGCGSAGLPLIAGLLLMGLMLVKLEEQELF